MKVCKFGVDVYFTESDSFGGSSEWAGSSSSVVVTAEAGNCPHDAERFPSGYVRLEVECTDGAEVVVDIGREQLRALIDALCVSRSELGL